ncbi:MAG TPA: glutamate--tRNA ligase [Candidatus Paceibacterota bacterium]|nr:glutamate--tRNA ligase [Candidatus Paceibacterota bacterium]
MNPERVVTRFAPSPTGFLHVGGVRTAIYAWLFAQKYGGTFILRIEDTDKEREVAGSIEHIQESLKWLGINWDQGPIKQSDRLDAYKKYARQLIDKGLAYPDPYTEEEVEKFRQEAEVQKKPFLYREHRPAATDAWDGTKPLRFKVPEIKRYTWHDLVRGELSAGEEALDDFILIKSDGYPTYNFAHIVDDLEMGVTHIMRGEEFISSTPKFLSLYAALSITPPQIATMPLILGPDGHKKLSKRDGAKDILDYRKEGYLPEAMINFLALLGWHPEGEQEVFSVDELVKAFEIGRVQKSGAKFDEAKLLWINHEHIKRLSPEDFAQRLEALSGNKVDRALAALIQDRAQTLGEAAQLLTTEFDFLAQEPSPSKELLLQGAKAEAVDAATYLAHAIELVGSMSEGFTAEEIKEVIFPYATDVGRSAVLWPMRVALSGKEKSPDPFTLAGLLGRERTIARLSRALAVLK